ncbi:MULTISPECIES: MFS transporter [unclassified Janthinobacterium]|uniref:MFS transporter n=1 Tax=unclassified Janthinobacterium TaxID=2610881 RepID=UPI0016096624|nr:MULTISPECIES: MFS transporter [unclassified Janthinobacterium]MBB5369622.1 DHA2 family methylenomycin A resistance protein-like MFS transporter [Janthinobacterium sp. K2C7]MBB5382422.1 DHA2 family methylenomycin A resistance protein-like MFS transporter [Janthinobacterium sp. K2Li3]MBB5387999.1 DHA2 family methylenomycin A resistance protein-like MFS transporter [Janthinobacterium sp. K2E3]
MLKSSLHLRFIQIATCLGFVLVLIDVSVVNVALEALRNAFHSDLTGLQWVVNAYALVFAALLLMAGALGDRLGAKRVFMAGFAIFTLASVGCGAASSLPSLIAWRLAQGLGAALLVPNSLSLLRQAFHDDQQRSRAIGWWGAGGGIALAAGPVIGGLLISALGWRSIFLINLPVGLIGLWMTYRYAPASPTQAGRSLDMPGQMTGAVTLATFTFALTQASSLGWQSPIIVGALLLSILLGSLFIWLEAHHPSPMLPLALFRDAAVSSATVIGLIVNLVFYGMVFSFSLFFQSVQHRTPQQTGLAFLPMMAILMVMNIIAGRLVSRIGTRQLAVTGLLISAIGYLLMLPALAMQSYLPLVLPMLLAGSGIALTIPTITNATLAAVPNTQAGIASGLLNAARQLGGVIGVAIFGFFVRQGETTLFMHGMHLALYTAVALLLTGAAVGLGGFKRRQQIPSL